MSSLFLDLTELREVLDMMQQILLGLGGAVAADGTLKFALFGGGGSGGALVLEWVAAAVDMLKRMKTFQKRYISLLSRRSRCNTSPWTICTRK